MYLRQCSAFTAPHQVVLSDTSILHHYFYIIIYYYLLIFIILGYNTYVILPVLHV